MTESTSKKRLYPVLVQDIICNKCNITFGKRHNLNAHIRKFHAEEKLSQTGSQICGMCNEGFRTTPQLHEHLKIQHDIKLQFVEETFYSEIDFQQWKAKIEKDNQLSFVVRSFQNKETSIKHSYYKCHRSGAPNLKADRKRQVKASGSIKTGVSCPAMIKVAAQTINDITEIKVQYQSVHVGHDLQVRTLRLCKEEKARLASSLRVGVPISKILDETRKAYSPTKRLAFTTRQDLYNIRRDFNICNPIVMHADDSKERDALVEALHKTESSHPQGSLKEVANASLELQKVCGEINSEVIDSFVANELKRLTAYIQSATSSTIVVPV